MGETIVHVDEDLQDLVPGFLENRRTDIELIRKHLEQGDMDAIRIVGHSMKGVGGGYGFDAITEIGASIEQAALDGDAGAIDTHVGRLEEYLSSVRVVYD